MFKKTIQLVLLMATSFAATGSTLSVPADKSVLKVQHNVTDSFAVSGNCGMCKRTIEGALKEVGGVVSAEWNVDTKMMHITYNPHKIAIATIKQKIADAGYDTDTIKAKEAAYNGLPGCCQYERE